MSDKNESYFASCDTCHLQLFTVQFDNEYMTIACPKCKKVKLRIAEAGIQQLAKAMRDTKLKTKTDEPTN